MTQETGPLAGDRDVRGVGERDVRDAGGRSDDAMTVSEERMVVGTQTSETGRVRAVKHVDTDHVAQAVPRKVESADVERADALAGDSGQVETLSDGSLSIPVFEEELVVTKRLVVRERVIVRKHTVYEEQQVSAELRRERLEIETEGDVPIIDDGAAGDLRRS